MGLADPIRMDAEGRQDDANVKVNVAQFGGDRRGSSQKTTNRIGIRTVPPSTGTPSFVMGRMRNSGISLIAAAPNPAPPGASSRVSHAVSVPSFVTLQDVTAMPLTFRCAAEDG